MAWRSTLSTCARKRGRSGWLSLAALDSAKRSCMRSRVRSMRLIVLMASTLDALVNRAGAAINVSTAKGLWVNGNKSAFIGGQDVEKSCRVKGLKGEVAWAGLKVICLTHND